MARFTDRRRLLRHSSVGIQFTLIFLLGVGAGYLLDEHLGTTPGFMANGAVLGFLVALWRLFRQGREVLDEGEKERRDAAARRSDEGAANGAGARSPAAGQNDGPADSEKPDATRRDEAR